MKVLWIFNHYAVLPTESGSTRHFSLAKGIINADWRSVIFASSYGHWNRNQRVKGAKTHSDKIVASVHYRFLKTFSYKGNGIFRLLNMIVYSAVALLPGSTSDLPPPDVVIGSSVHPFAALVAAYIAKRKRVPFIFEIRDLWPETLVRMNRLSEKGVLARALYWLESYLLRAADKVVVVLPNIERYFEDRGIKGKSVIWIPNGVDFYKDAGKAKSSTDFTIVYLGAHGAANDLKTLLAAIKCFQGMPSNRKVIFRFIGEGPLKKELIDLARDYRLENVIFEDGVGKELVPEKLRAADACMVAVKDIPDLYKYGISLNKIYDYMAAGRPVLAAMSTANNPIKDSGAGLTVEAEQSEQMAQAIRKLTEMSEKERMEMGKKGKDYVHKFHDYSILAANFAQVLDELYKKTG